MDEVRLVDRDDGRVDRLVVDRIGRVLRVLTSGCMSSAMIVTGLFLNSVAQAAQQSDTL